MGVYKVKDTWYIDYYDNGVRVREAVGKKRSEALAALEARRTDIRRGKYKFKSHRKIKFEDFSEEYLEYIKINKKEWKRNETSLKSLKAHFKGKYLSRILPKDIEEYKKKRVEKVQPITVNRDLGCLRHLFNVAKKFRIYDGENPLKEVVFFQERDREMGILNKEEANKLINVAERRLKPIIIVALNTAMRRGEIFSLKWNDIDFKENFIYIKETKTGFARKVPMNSFVKDTLKKTKRESDYVFTSPRKKTRLTSVTKPFKNACDKIGIPHLRFHDLRHTAATYMTMAGIDLVTVSQILGHSDIKMTMKYAHPTPENKRKAVDALGLIFRSKRKKIIDTIQPQEQNKEDLTSLLSNN